MNCSSSAFMTWRRCVVRGNIGEMVNRDRCICLLLMGASKATMLMSSSAADSRHLLGSKSLLSIDIYNNKKKKNVQSNLYVCGFSLFYFYFKKEPFSRILSKFNGCESCEDSWSQFVRLLYYLKAKAHKRKNKAQLLIVLATLWILMITIALCIKFLQKGWLLLTLFYNFTFSCWLLLPLRTFVRSFSECHYILTGKERVSQHVFPKS